MLSNIHNFTIQLIENLVDIADSKVCNLLVLKTTGCRRLFFKFSPVGGGCKFFNNR